MLVVVTGSVGVSIAIVVWLVVFVSIVKRLCCDDDGHGVGDADGSGGGGGGGVSGGGGVEGCCIGAAIGSVL